MCERSEDNRGCCNRVSEESEGCDNSDNILIVSVCIDGVTDLYGCSHPEMYT